MQTNNHKIVDYDIILDKKFGKEGTPERAQAEENAYSFYSVHHWGLSLSKTGNNR